MKEGFNYMEKLFKEVLNESRIKLLETIRNYKVNPEDRAWFISQDGSIYGGFTHHSIIKSNFIKDWEAVKNSKEEEWTIIETFEQRLIKTGSAKIGEFNEKFYLTVLYFNDIIRDMIQGFVISLIEAKEYDIQNCEMFIETLSDHKVQCNNLVDISKGCLYKDLKN